MRYVSLLLTIMLGIYLAACAVALVVGAIGVWGHASDPLAMVFAIMLALPGSIVLGSVADPAAPPGSFVLVILSMAINASLLWFVRRLTVRQAR